MANRHLERPEIRVGPDIDLDAEVVLDGQGERITEAAAEQIAEDAMERLYERRRQPSPMGVSRRRRSRPG